MSRDISFQAVSGVLAVLLTASCGDGGPTGANGVAEVVVVPVDAATVPNGTVALHAQVLDHNGAPVSGEPVTWSTAHAGNVIVLEADGLVHGVNIGGPVSVTASAGGRSGNAQVSVLTTGFDVIDSMLASIFAVVTAMVERQRADLPRNQRIAEYIEAKIAMLERPELTSEIVRGRYRLDTVTVGVAEPVRIGVLFPLESMRAGAGTMVAEVRSALPLLESFMGEPFPSRVIDVWYGFGIGNSGGGGTMNLEDQVTYEARWMAGMLPYLPIVAHELGHSWLGHESLTQFLELYAYNVARANTTDAALWPFTRNWVPDQAGNTGIHAILDIYTILGHDAMADAYRALRQLHPPYGQLLSPAARDAIIDRAPADRRADVAAKVDMIGY